MENNEVKNDMTELNDASLEQISGGAAAEVGGWAKYIASNRCPECDLDWRGRADGPYPKGEIVLVLTSRGGLGVQFACCGVRRMYPTEHFQLL